MQNKQQLIEHAKFMLYACGTEEAKTIIRIALEKLTAPEPVPVHQQELALVGWMDITVGDVVSNRTKCRTLYAAPAALDDVLPGDAIWSADPSKVNQMDDSQKVAGWKAYRAELLRRINLIESGQWKIVPVEPTPEMIAGFWGNSMHEQEGIDATKDGYRAMLAAAPEFGK